MSQILLNDNEQNKNVSQDILKNYLKTSFLNVNKILNKH